MHEPRPPRTGRKRPIALAVALLGAGVLWGAGCGAVGARSGAGAEEADVVVVVESHHWSDVRLFRVQGPERRRLGVVPSMSRRRFRLGGGLNPGRMLRLEAVPVGGARAHRTAPLQVGPGDEVRWVLENELALSVCTVR